MKKSSSELYIAHCSKLYGAYSEGNWDWSGQDMYRNHFSLKCRKGFFESAEKVKNTWVVDESEYFEKSEEFSPYIRKKNKMSTTAGSYKHNGNSGPASSLSGDDVAKIIGGGIGLLIALVAVIGVIKGGSGSSSYSGSGYSSQSSGGSMTINGESYTQQQFEDKLRGEAERLYDNCQAFGSGFSDKCP